LCHVARISLTGDAARPKHFWRARDQFAGALLRVERVSRIFLGVRHYIPLAPYQHYFGRYFGWLPTLIRACSSERLIIGELITGQLLQSLGERRQTPRQACVAMENVRIAGRAIWRAPTRNPTSGGRGRWRQSSALFGVNLFQRQAGGGGH
jgi:hypothetical protein